MTTHLNVRERRELRRKACQAILEALCALCGEGGRSAIERQAPTEGGFSARELLAPAFQTAADYRRLVDHDLSWALTDLKCAGLVRNPQRGTWRPVNSDVTQTEPAAGGPFDRKRLNELRRMA